MLRLAQLHNSQGSRFLRKQMLRGNNFTLVLAGAGLERAVLLDDLIAAAFAQALQLEESLPFTRAEFESTWKRYCSIHWKSWPLSVSCSPQCPPGRGVIRAKT